MGAKKKKIKIQSRINVVCTDHSVFCVVNYGRSEREVIEIHWKFTKQIYWVFTITFGSVLYHQLMPSVKFTTSWKMMPTVEIHQLDVLLTLILLHGFQSDQQSSGTEASSWDPDVITQTYRKHCGHLLCLLHYFWHFGSSGEYISSTS